ncbi:unnamed protein product [Caenorhabditis brenneri]
MFPSNLFFLICLSLLASFTVSSLPLIGIRDDVSSEFVGVGLRDDLALPRRRVEKSTESPFCLAHRQTYDDYCSNFWTDRPQRLQTALFTFCPGYENKCLHL